MSNYFLPHSHSGLRGIVTAGVGVRTDKTRQRSRIRSFSRIIFKLDKAIHCLNILAEVDYWGYGSLDIRVMDHSMIRLILAFVSQVMAIKVGTNIGHNMLLNINSEFCHWNGYITILL